LVSVFDPIKPAILEPKEFDGWLNRSLGIEVLGPAPESAPRSWPGLAAAKASS